jgi:hypothetical protein
MKRGGKVSGIGGIVLNNVAKSMDAEASAVRNVILCGRDNAALYGRKFPSGPNLVTIHRMPGKAQAPSPSPAKPTASADAAQKEKMRKESRSFLQSIRKMRQGSRVAEPSTPESAPETPEIVAVERSPSPAIGAADDYPPISTIIA